MSNDSNKLRIFLCHSTDDKQIVRKLYQDLCVEGFEPWLDEENILPGEDWRQKITEAVRCADVVLVCLSRHSIGKKGFVQKEIKYALDVADEQPENTIYLIPLKLEECLTPERLRPWHWVSLYEPKGYERLINALKHRSNSVKINSTSRLEKVGDFNQQNIFLENDWKGKEVLKKQPELNGEQIDITKSAILPDKKNAKNKIKNLGWKRIGIIILAVAIITGTVIAVNLFRKQFTNPSTGQESPKAKAEVYLQEGKRCYEKKDYECAVVNYNKAIEINSNYAEAYYYRGNSYDDNSNYDAAIEDFNTAIKINPLYAEAYFNRGVSYDNKGDYDQAVISYTEVIKLRPRFVSAYINRGGTYARKEKYDLAIEDYNTAIKLEPQHAGAFYNRASTYDEIGKYNLAIKDYTSAIKLKPDYAEAYVNRGVVYDNIGNYRQAIKDYTKAIELNPQDDIAYDNRRVDYERIGEKTKAQADKKKLEELNIQVK